jgi:zinc transport system permease protein
MIFQLFSEAVPRAVAAGLIIAPLLAVLGVFATLRRMALFGEGVGHATLAGVAIAVIAGLSPLPVALAWGLAVAYAMYRLERSTKLPPDSVLGILFTTSMAFGIVLFSAFSGNGDLDILEQTLFGSVLSVSAFDLLLTAVVSIGIFFWLSRSLRAVTFLSLSPDSAYVSGVNVRRHTLILYLSLAAAIVFGVKLVGLILVSALLIIPAAAARQLSRTFHGTLVLTVLVSEAAMLMGLLASVRYHLPSGAPIVLAASAIFAVFAIVGKMRRA